MDDDALRQQLIGLWYELERRCAAVNRIGLNVHPDILRGRITHESRRLRALDERDS